MTRKLREAILDLWAGGLSEGRIADRLGVTRSRVAGAVAAARKRGDARAARRKRAATPAEIATRDERILAMYVEGARYAEIAEAAGCSISNIEARITRAREAGDPRAQARRYGGDPESAARDERILDMWAAGATCPQIGEAVGLSASGVSWRVLKARAAGDPRAAAKRAQPEFAAPVKAARRAVVSSAVVSPAVLAAPARAAPAAPGAPLRAMGREEREDAAQVAAEAEAATSRDAEILAALEAEPRPRGTAWGYPEIPRAALAPVRLAPPRRVDVTAQMFGDPAPGRSALDMRGAS